MALWTPSFDIPENPVKLKGLLLDPVKLTKRQAQIYQTMRRDRLVTIWRVAELLGTSHKETIKFILSTGVGIFQLVPMNKLKVFSSDVVRAVDRCLINVNMDRDTTKRLRSTLLTEASRRDTGKILRDRGRSRSGHGT